MIVGSSRHGPLDLEVHDLGTDEVLSWTVVIWFVGRC